MLVFVHSSSINFGPVLNKFLHLYFLISGTNFTIVCTNRNIHYYNIKEIYIQRIDAFVIRPTENTLILHYVIVYNNISFLQFTTRPICNRFRCLDGTQLYDAIQMLRRYSSHNGVLQLILDTCISHNFIHHAL